MVLILYVLSILQVISAVLAPSDLVTPSILESDQVRDERGRTLEGCFRSETRAPLARAVLSSVQVGREFSNVSDPGMGSPMPEDTWEMDYSMHSVTIWRAWSPMVEVSSERASASAKVSANVNHVGMVDSSSVALVSPWWSK